MKKLKVQGFAKLAVLSVLAVGFAVAAYHLLSPKIMVAHASSAFRHSKEAVQARPITAHGQHKIYLKTAPINVSFGNSRWTADKTTIRDWLTITGGEISVDPSEFVALIASEVNIAPTNESDGRSVDTDNLTNQIRDVLNQGRPNRTIALVTSVVIYHSFNCHKGWLIHS